MFARWQLRYLEDPKGALGGRERIHALVRKNFYQDFPVEVTEFLSRLYIPLPELEAIMAEANDSSYEKAVEDYVKAHPKTVDYWVTGKISQ